MSPCFITCVLADEPGVVAASVGVAGIGAGVGGDTVVTVGLTGVGIGAGLTGDADAIGVPLRSVGGVVGLATGGVGLSDSAVERSIGVSGLTIGVSERMPGEVERSGFNEKLGVPVTAGRVVTATGVGNGCGRATGLCIDGEAVGPFTVGAG